MTFKLVPVVASVLALSSTSALAQSHHRYHHRGSNPYGAYNSVDMPRGWNGPAGSPARIAPGRDANSGWLDDSNLYGGSPD
jgi:hypothetical protein